jgi:phage shock protein PspC (stress-responsive transcriptional regulator)
MIWFVMEAMLAVVLFLLIIWWTMPRKPRRDPGKKE